MSPDAGLTAVLALCRPSTTVLIDGPSGSGKSTFADRLVAAWPIAQLVRLDDVYPGWSGLAAASRSIVTESLEPRALGKPSGWTRWDWVREGAGERRMLDPDRPLIVEGCGALSRAAAPLADIRVWVSAGDVVRKQRALERDEGGFDAHWDMWDAQWNDFVAREHPESLATHRIEAVEAA